MKSKHRLHILTQRQRGIAHTAFHYWNEEAIAPIEACFGLKYGSVLKRCKRFGNFRYMYADTKWLHVIDMPLPEFKKDKKDFELAVQMEVAARLPSLYKYKPTSKYWGRMKDGKLMYFDKLQHVALFAGASYSKVRALIAKGEGRGVVKGFEFGKL